MAFVAAATSVGAAVLGTGAAAGIGSTIVGGALIGAGIGGAYSAITGDGNILNSMLTGGLIGGGVGGIGGAMFPGAAGYGPAAGLSPGAAAAAPSTAAAPTSNVVTGTAATTKAPITAAQAIDKAPAFAYTPSGEMVSSAYPASVTGAYNTAGVVPPPPAGVGPAAAASSGLTGKQMLGYGLAGSAALSLLGGRQGQKIPTQPGTPSYIRPYTYTSSINQPTGVYPNPYVTTEYDEAGNPIIDSRERDYFTQSYEAQPIYQAAQGGLMDSSPVERMSTFDRGRGMYPMGMIDQTNFAKPTQRPASMEVVQGDYDTPVNPMTGLPPIRMNEGGITLDEYIKNQVLPGASSSAPSYTYDPAKQQYSKGAPTLDQSAIPAGFNPLVVQAYQAQNPNTFRYDPVKQRYSSPIPTQDQYNSYLSGLEGQRDEYQRSLNPFGMFGMLSPFGGYEGYAAGGQAGGEYNLGSYSDGGRLLKGPGDGMSDNIPAMIGKKQPARLADGEFVVPADVVSHLGNGSTDAGAKRLYAMMDKVRKARTGNKKQGKQIKAEKFIPV